MKQARANPIQMSLERASSVGLVDQITTHLEQLIAQGVLRSGEQLPSVRQFGVDQGLAPQRWWKPTRGSLRGDWSPPAVVPVFLLRINRPKPSRYPSLVRQNR